MTYHDHSKVLLGGRLSSIIEMTTETGSPKLFKAGLAVRLTSADTLALAGSNPLIGVSMGESLVDPERTDVARVGNMIPLLLDDKTAQLNVGDLFFTAVEPGEDGNEITVTVEDIFDDGSCSVMVVGVKDIVIAIEAGVTDAQTIKEAIDEDPQARLLVDVTIDNGEEDTPQLAFSEQNLEGGETTYPEVGKTVRIDPYSGKASSSGDETSAVYLSERKTGIYPNKESAPCALISLIGGF